MRIKKAAVILLSITALLADEPKQYNTEHIEQFEYNRGFKQGIERGYKSGYADAIVFAKKQLRLYAKKIKALEAGKYLKEYDKKITNPAIYQTKQGNNINIIVRGCRIEKPLTPDEILELPLYPIDTSTNGQFSYSNADESNVNIFDNTRSDSSDVLIRDGNGFFGSRPKSSFVNTDSFFYIENSAKNRKHLNTLNYSYAIENNRIKIVFKNSVEREAFIKNMGY